MSILCSKCKKRPAVVFVQRLDGADAGQNEGYCFVCAKELGIKPVTDMMEKLGIDEEQLEAMSEEMSQMLESGSVKGWV